MEMNVFATSGQVKGYVENQSFHIQTESNTIAVVVLRHKNRNFALKINGKTTFIYNSNTESMWAKSYSQHSSISVISTSNDKIKKILEKHISHFDPHFRTNAPSSFFSKTESTYKKHSNTYAQEGFKKIGFKELKM